MNFILWLVHGPPKIMIGVLRYNIVTSGGCYNGGTREENVISHGIKIYQTTSYGVKNVCLHCLKNIYSIIFF